MRSGRSSRHWARAPWSAPTPGSGRPRSSPTWSACSRTPACRSRRTPRCEPDVPVHQVVRCAELAAAAEPDVVVGMGGGSCLDLAKAVAVLLTHGGTPADYYGELRVPGPVVPVVALPTTAGHGVGGDAGGGAHRPRPDQQGGDLQSLPDPARRRLRPGADRRLPGPAHRERGRGRPLPRRRGLHRDPPAGDLRARHRARLRRQERADRHLRAARCPPDRREPAPRVVRPRTTSTPARR